MPLDYIKALWIKKDKEYGIKLAKCGNKFKMFTKNIAVFNIW